jgi:CBS domain-containing protein
MAIGSATPTSTPAETTVAGKPRTAADVMTPSPRTCSPFSKVLEAVLIFRDADCGAVPVVEAGKPIGVLTDRDVALALANYPDLVSREVTEVMTKGVITVKPTDPLTTVRERFGEHAVRRLLVIDEKDQLVGIVAWADIAQYLDECPIGQVVEEVVTAPSTA